jgi:Flp pilus assembly protein TadB
MTPREKKILVVAGVAVTLLLVLAATLAFGYMSAQTANARADERIKAEAENRARIEAADNERHKETDKKLADLEDQKKQPASAAEIIAMLRASMPPNSAAPTIIIRQRAPHQTRRQASCLMLQARSFCLKVTHSLRCAIGRLPVVNAK